MVKNLPAMCETWVRSLGWEDSPGEGNGYPLEYSGLENSMDCIVHGDTTEQLSLYQISHRDVIYSIRNMVSVLTLYGNRWLLDL